MATATYSTWRLQSGFLIHGQSNLTLLCANNQSGNVKRVDFLNVRLFLFRLGCLGGNSIGFLDRPKLGDSLKLGASPLSLLRRGTDRRRRERGAEVTQL